MRSNKYRGVHTIPRYSFFPYISHYLHIIEMKSPAEKVKNDLPAGLSCFSIKLSFVCQGAIVWFINWCFWNGYPIGFHNISPSAGRSFWQGSLPPTTGFPARGTR